MKLEYKTDKYLITISNLISEDIFLNLCGAGKGFSKTLFKRIYDCIFLEIIDIEEEFEKYYSIEYNSLWQFLLKKYNIKIEDIIQLKEIKACNPNIIIYKKQNSHLWLEQLIFSDSMFEKIMNILLMKETK